MKIIVLTSFVLSSAALACAGTTPPPGVTETRLACVPDRFAPPAPQK